VLAVLALLPPGVMSARTGDAMTVVICTGDGPLTLGTDSQGQPVAPRAHGQRRQGALRLRAAGRRRDPARVHPVPVPAPRIRPFDPARLPPLAVRTAGQP
jgi:hypothetical protein